MGDTVIMEILDEYLEMHKIGDYQGKPTWYDALAFFAGYVGEINIRMVIVVRKYQGEGKIE